MAIAAIKYGLPRMMNEVSSESEGDWPFPKWWPFIVRYIAPLVGIVLVSWWMIESPSFFVTCLTQWGAIIIIFYLINGFMNKRFSENLNS
jgi:Zn-dependent protease